jgi:hypothetical protein
MCRDDLALVAWNPRRDATVVLSSFTRDSPLAGRQFSADVRHDRGLPRQCYLWRAAAYVRYGYPLLGELQDPVAESETEETARGRPPCILPGTRDAKWISFELQYGDDLPDAKKNAAESPLEVRGPIPFEL